MKHGTRGTRRGRDPEEGVGAGRTDRLIKLELYVAGARNRADARCEQESRPHPFVLQSILL